jgi:hypothetical protein
LVVYGCILKSKEIMNNNITHFNGDFEVEDMKQVLINGSLVNFTVMSTTQTLTEEVNPNFLGYSKEYYINGNKHISPTPIKFYR